MSSKSASYAEAGVDITAGYEAVRRIGSHTERTRIPGVLGGLGGFGGLFELTGYKEPVLVSGTDGVGTKLKLAFAMDKHDSIGIDCVAMCVNDVICSGARPLFFLDYIATGKLKPDCVEQIVKGIADACCESGCALIGGETAEMPGFYPENEYDLAGFCVGAAEKSRLMSKTAVKAGDALIALPSSGLHSNGFSLVRRLIDIAGGELERYEAELSMTLGEALLTPTRLYAKALTELTEKVCVHSAAHITGGGFYENIPRILPDGLCARIERKALRVPPVFGLIAGRGKIPERDMFNTFNMGVGMVLAVNPADADAVLRLLCECGHAAYAMGEVTSGEEGVLIC